MKNLEGLVVAARFSCGCPQLTEMRANAPVYDFARFPIPERFFRAKEVLERLEPFLSYQLIAFTNKIPDPFDEKVVRAYWLGDDELLKPITREDITEFLSQTKDVLHSVYLIKILEMIGGKLNHNFEVVWMLKKIESDPRLIGMFLGNLNNCLVRPGEITEINEKNLLVRTKWMILNDRLVALEEKEEAIDFGFGFIGPFKKGDLVAIHLGSVREIIDRETVEKLSKITQEAIAFFNRAK